MSGGSMNYLYYQIEEEADKMGDRELIALMKDVATLTHDREWYLSGDICVETWDKSAAAFKKMVRDITSKQVERLHRTSI